MEIYWLASWYALKIFEARNSPHQTTKPRKARSASLLTHGGAACLEGLRWTWWTSNIFRCFQDLKKSASLHFTIILLVTSSNVSTKHPPRQMQMCRCADSPSTGQNSWTHILALVSIIMTWFVTGNQLSIFYSKWRSWIWNQIDVYIYAYMYIDDYICIVIYIYTTLNTLFPDLTYLWMDSLVSPRRRLREHLGYRGERNAAGAPTDSPDMAISCVPGSCFGWYYRMLPMLGC